MTRYTTATAIVLFACAVLLAAPHRCASGEPAESLDVRLFRNGQLTLNAEGVPLQRILRRLARQGIGIRIDPDISLTVSAAYEKTDIRRVLDAILKDCNYALIWRGCELCPEGEIRLSEIRIFRPGGKDRLQPLRADTPLDIARDPDTGAFYVRNEVLVRLTSEKERSRLQALLEKTGATIADTNDGVYRIALPDGVTVAAFLELLKTRQIAEAEPNYAYRLGRPYGMVDPSIMPPALNQRGPSGKAAPVAVFDSGLSPEFSQAPYVQDTFNAMNPDAPVSDTQGHGTQMAMIASGAVAPLGKKAEGDTIPVISIQGFDENGFTSNYTLMRGIDFALEKGARVLSLSWHTTTESPFLKQYLEKAGEEGLIIVAAAGNEPTGTPVYPAADSGILGVGALAPDGSDWSESNYGKFVSVKAPGFANLPTGYNGPAGIYAGTSIATAYTAYRIAGYLAENPDANREDVNGYLKKSAETGPKQ